MQENSGLRLQDELIRIVSQTFDCKINVTWNTVGKPQNNTIKRESCFQMQQRSNHWSEKEIWTSIN